MHIQSKNGKRGVHAHVQIQEQSDSKSSQREFAADTDLCMLSDESVPTQFRGIRKNLSRKNAVVDSLACKPPSLTESQLNPSPCASMCGLEEGTTNAFMLGPFLPC
jgi:hypothetical protein